MSKRFMAVQEYLCYFISNLSLLLSFYLLYKKLNKNNVMGCGMREVYVSFSIVMMHSASYGRIGIEKPSVMRSYLLWRGRMM